MLFITVSLKQNEIKMLVILFIAGPRRYDGPRCKDVMRQLEDQVVLLTGGRDRRGGGVISFPHSGRRERMRSDDYIKILEYLTSLPWSVSLSFFCYILFIGQ